MESSRINEAKLNNKIMNRENFMLNLKIYYVEIV